MQRALRGREEGDRERPEGATQSCARLGSDSPDAETITLAGLRAYLAACRADAAAAAVCWCASSILRWGAPKDGGVFVLWVGLWGVEVMGGKCARAGGELVGRMSMSKGLV
jgi:hypothetical protein